MKVGMLIKTDGGSWALTESEALEIFGYAQKALMGQWRELRDEGKKPSAEFYEKLESVQQIIKSFSRT